MRSGLSSSFEPIFASTPDGTLIDAIVIASQSPPSHPMAAPVQEEIEEQAKTSIQLLEKANKNGPLLKNSGQADPIVAGAISFMPVRATAEQLAGLSSISNVLGVVPNQRLVPVEPLARSRSAKKEHLSWPLECLKINDLWNNTRGEKVLVGVVDTGVDAAHPTLAPCVDRFVAFDPQLRKISSRPAFDTDFHGTHVCGLIAGQKDAVGKSIGVAPGAKLCVASITLGTPKLAKLLKAINWLVDRGCTVINLSAGLQTYDPVIESFFEDLLHKGVVTVAAIGNSSLGSGHFPATTPATLAVGAVDCISNDYDKISSFEVWGSSSGATISQTHNNHLVKPDVVAPGVGIRSCIPVTDINAWSQSFERLDGTSMAAGLVSGVVALLRSAKKTKTAVEVVEAIKKTARHPQGNSSHDNRWGRGLIDPSAALAAL